MRCATIMMDGWMEGKWTGRLRVQNMRIYEDKLPTDRPTANTLMVDGYWVWKGGQTSSLREYLDGLEGFFVEIKEMTSTVSRHTTSNATAIPGFNLENGLQPPF